MNRKIKFDRNVGLIVNDWFERYMYLLIPSCLVLGVLCSEPLLPFVPYVPWMFGLVTFVMGLGCGRRDVMGAFRQPVLFAAIFILTHIISPIAAYGIGTLLFGAGSSYTAGLVLFTIIPLGISSVLWVEMARESVPLMLALVVMDSLLSPIVVPASLSAMFGATIAFDVWAMLLDLLWIIVVPTVAGICIYEWSGGKAKASAAPVLLPASKAAFVGVVLLNAAAIGPYVRAWGSEAIGLFFVVLLLVAVCYVLGWGLSLMFKRSGTAMQGTLGFASGMRNISLGLVLAMRYFGPETAVAVVLAILIQQPAATVYHAILQKINKLSAGQMEKG